MTLLNADIQMSLETATALFDRNFRSGILNTILNLVQIILFLAVVALWAWDRRRQLISIQAVERCVERAEAAITRMEQAAKRSGDLLDSVETLTEVTAGYAKTASEQKQAAAEATQRAVNKATTVAQTQMGEVLTAIHNNAATIGTAANPLEVIVQKPKE